MDVVVRERKISDIALIEAYGNDGKPRKPMVIIYHGYTANREQLIIHAYRLAKEGFVVVLPDAYNHGDRRIEGTVCDLFEAIEKSTQDINVIIDSYAENNLVDIERVGLTGYSMGGCITYNYLIQKDRRISAAVPIIATPDWVALISTNSGKEILKSTNVKNDEDLERLKGEIGKIQPMEKYQLMSGIPIKILNGEIDAIIPVEGVKKLHELLEPEYEDKEDISIKIYPGVGHAITPDMIDDTNAWFIKHLKEEV
jgi:dienelactone hydrolase